MAAAARAPEGGKRAFPGSLPLLQVLYSTQCLSSWRLLNREVGELVNCVCSCQFLGLVLSGENHCPLAKKNGGFLQALLASQGILDPPLSLPFLPFV